MSRKSLANKVLGTQQVLCENDDEAERLTLRCNSKESSTAADSTPPNRRHSLGLSYLTKISEPQMKEHISHCIKLNAENKINVKNAFTLEMIDFITFMVTRKKSEMPDLQVASMALDVCTKIYAYRVDGLYTDIIQMAGGLVKHEKNSENTAKEQEPCNNEETQLKSQVKKKRKNIQQICSTESALKGRIDTSFPLKSLVLSGDSHTTDMLWLGIQPIHANSGFYYHQYRDVILDTVDDTKAQEKNCSEYTIPVIEDYSNLDICPQFTDFNFLDWSDKDEPEVLESNQQDNENNFQFDLDASIPTAEEHRSVPENYFDIQEDEDNVNLCMRNPEKVENIVDLRNIVLMQVPELNKSSEYSFIQKNFIHWAGPSYWKIKTFGKILGNSKVIETCRQVAVKKKAIVLEYTDDIKSAVKQGFTLVPAAKIQYKTTPKSWKETKKTLPEDVHYNDSQLNRLYVYPSLILNHDQKKDQLNTTELPEDENYDYNNPNDTLDYCPNIDTHDEEIEKENDYNELRIEDKDMAVDKVAFIGDNLVVPPKLTQNINVPYATRAKKIDMCQLKKCIWNCLTSVTKEGKKNEEEAESENTKRVKEPKHFNMVYKSLPAMLSKTNVESLSVPVAFVSLLHLTNEKSLSLSSLSDLSDIIINED